MASAVKSVLTREWGSADYAMGCLEDEVGIALRNLEGLTIVSVSHSLSVTGDGRFVGSALITYEVPDLRPV